MKDSRLKRAGVSGFNKPKRTPSHPTKSHVVVAKVGSQVKTIRFGQQGVTGKKQNKSANKPKTLGDTREEIESRLNAIQTQMGSLMKQKSPTPAQKEKISQAIERLSDEKMALMKQRRLLIQRANEIKKKMAKDSISKGKK